jgi:hypothetical protein
MGVEQNWWQVVSCAPDNSGPTNESLFVCVHRCNDGLPLFKCIGVGLRRPTLRTQRRKAGFEGSIPVSRHALMSHFDPQRSHRLHTSAPRSRPSAEQGPITTSQMATSAVAAESQQLVMPALASAWSQKPCARMTHSRKCAEPGLNEPEPLGPSAGPGLPSVLAGQAFGHQRRHPGHLPARRAWRPVGSPMQPVEFDTVQPRLDRQLASKH